mgnify:CR=1 FL=1
MRNKSGERRIKKILRADTGCPWSVESGMREAFAKIRARAGGAEQTGRRRRYFVPGTAVIAALILSMTAVSAAAAALYSWSPRVAEKFQASPEAQEELIRDHLTGNLEASSVSGGVTVELEQALTVPDYLYISLKITAPKGVKFTGDTGFSEAVLTIDGEEDAFSAISGTMEADPETRSVCYWNLWAQQPGGSIEGKTAGIHLKDLVCYSDKGGEKASLLAGGTWDLTWTVGEVFEGKTFTVEKAMPDSSYTIHTVTLTPISFSLTADLPRGGEEQEETAGAGAAAESRAPEWNPVAFCMRDGTTENFDWTLPHREGYVNPEEEDSLYYQKQGFCRVYDLDNICGILFVKAEGGRIQQKELVLS